MLIADVALTAENKTAKKAQKTNSDSNNLFLFITAYLIKSPHNNIFLCGKIYYHLFKIKK